ncbi:MAG: prepilin peptidase [Trueperaceae bacterium]
MSPEAWAWVLVGVLGALVGSFANVVIQRLPAGRSIVRPRSACGACGRTLSPWELVPIVSWALLRARCHGCGAPISVRYPLVEAAMMLSFLAVAWRFAPWEHPVAFVAVATWWTILLIASLIDLDTFEIPDVLTLPATAAGLAAAFAWTGAPGLPGPADAALGAAIGAGLLTLINRLGAWVLRRFRDTRERLWPIGFDQANLAALAGTLGGVWVGLLAAAASTAANLATRRTLRIPEPVVWIAWGAALVVAPLGIGLLPAVTGGLAAAGAASLAGATVWWIHDLRRPRPADPGARSTPDADPGAAEGADAAAEEPVAMGFGDVKLAALLGVVLGWDRLLVALFAAVLVGAVVGVAQRAAGGSRTVPFGPFLALGGVIALAFGAALIDGYLGLLGL